MIATILITLISATSAVVDIFTITDLTVTTRDGTVAGLYFLHVGTSGIKK